MVHCISRRLKATRTVFNNSSTSAGLQSRLYIEYWKFVHTDRQNLTLYTHGNKVN